MLGSPPAKGKLISCRQGEFADKVFVVVNDRRRWMPSEEHLKSYGFSWPADVTIVDEDFVRALSPGSPVSMRRSISDGLSRKSPAIIREVATSALTGTGVEFGAGTHPVAVPLDCSTKYADFLQENELRQRAYAAQGTDFVTLDYVTSMEEMQGIPDGSLDFILASHVIEHTRNPLCAFQKAFTKLKAGGQLVLFVPDMRLTFDKARDVTTLEHLIADFEQPLMERDTIHYVEFFSLAFVTPIESLYQRVRNAISTNYDIHFHTWTYESFGEMVAYSARRFAPWSKIWSEPAVEKDENANEFYFVMTK